MDLAEILTTELDAFSKKIRRKKLDILETGTIRGDEGRLHPNDGWSTLVFAEYVKKNGGTFTSIDLHTETGKSFLKEKKLDAKVNFCEGHSVDVLTGMVVDMMASEDAGGILDVVLLDSANSGELILAEYLVVCRMLRRPALVIVDDVDIESDGVVKGHQIVPWIQDLGILYRIEWRQATDYNTGVLIFEVE